MIRNKLLFLDIDGTLLDASYKSNDSVLPSLINELQSSEEYVFALNSNRSIEDMLPIADQFSIKGPVVGENGVFAYYPGTKTTEYFLPEDQLFALRTRKQKLERTIKQALAVYFSGSRIHWENTDTVEAISRGGISSEYRDGDIVVLNNRYRKFTTSAHIYRVRTGRLATMPIKEVAHVLDVVKQTFSMDDYVLSYDKNFSNILGYSSLTSKRVAVEKLLKRYPNVSLYSIGDDMNDYLMTKGIGYFMTTSNAAASVRSKAMLVSGSPYAQGVRDLIQGLSDVADEEGEYTKEELRRLGYDNLEALGPGETSAVLYEAIDPKRNSVVIKLGSVHGDNEEVDANREGYESIGRSGAGGLVPSPIIYGHIGSRSMMVMPHLGLNISDLDKLGHMGLDQYRDMLGKLVTVIKPTVKAENTDQAKGLQSLIDCIAYWLGRSVDAGLLSSEEITTVTKMINVDNISSPYSSLMLLDFTPDNLFFNERKLSFVDPWRQETYRGSFVPSMAQFLTLGAEVMQLKNATRAQDVIMAAIHEVGDILKLDDSKLDAQVALGKALQYSLSAFVRIESDQSKAGHYVEHAMSELHKCVSISNQ